MMEQHEDFTAKLLIVDDIATNIDVLRNALINEKFHIFAARSGEEALNIIEDINPNLVLMDVMMGGIDGFETCRKIKSIEKFKDTPVIFVTAKKEGKDIEEAFSSGGSDYISKPIKFEEVCARVKVQYELWKTNQEKKLLVEELESKNKELSLSHIEIQTAHDLIKNNQEKIIQSEKISSLGSMVVNVAHEIDNPCNFIINNISGVHKTSDSLKTTLYEILPNDKVGDRIKKLLNPKFEKIEEMVQLSKEGTKRIVDIIKSLREFTSESNYQGSKIIKSTDATKLIKESIELLSHLLSDIELTTNFEEDLKAECYPGKISQVLTNIISNAIYASKHGPNKPALTLNAFQENGYVNFEIKDNGAGIPEESKSKVFDPSHVLKPITEGSRIGLSISYEIIKSHNGNIYYSSGPKGTTFNILIPNNMDKKNV